MDVTYSPDGQFLGLITADMAKTEIVVWDIEADRLQVKSLPRATLDWTTCSSPMEPRWEINRGRQRCPQISRCKFGTQ